MNLSTFAFIGAGIMVGLVIFNKVGAGTGILIGAGLLGVAAYTQPNSNAVGA